MLTVTLHYKQEAMTILQDVSPEKMKIFIEPTKDGSPTAYFDGFESERMHHRNGAFGETIYLYGPVIQWAFCKVEAPRILSLGTGIGYNEIIATAFELIFETQCRIDSFEADTRLNNSLKNWVLGLVDPTQVVPFSVYNAILNLTAQTFDLPQDLIFTRLKEKILNQTWILHGAFSEPQFKYNAIIYDFFSTKAMTSFWEESYLQNFFEKASDDFCAMGTYACTGALKRSLKNNGYQFMKRKGFSWKKASIFAFKNKKGVS